MTTGSSSWHDAERQLRLELARPRRKRTHAGAQRLLARRRQQARLADPLGPLDHHDAAVSRSQTLDDRRKLAELVLALAQRGGGEGHVGAILRRRAGAAAHRPPRRGSLQGGSSWSCPTAR
jgi:hypothetical protein